MGRLDKSARKARYYDRLLTYLKTHDRVLVVHADHVGSKQMSDIRISLRGKAVILMGKNTTIRTAMKTLISSTPGLEKLLEVVKLNIGFVFCTGAEPGEVRDIILQNRVPAPAKAGTVAPVDVFIPAGPTGMDPGSTSFFQALGIPTKIVKGQIEIQGEIHLIKKEDKVTASAATLLQKLDIRPFSYGLKVAHVYDDGYCYSAEVLDLGADVLIEKFRLGVLNVAAMSKQLNLPTAASAPHCIMEGFKQCTALVLETDFEFPQMQKIKEMIKNPGAFAAAAATSAAAAGGGGGDGGKSGAAAAAAAAAEESEEEDEADMGFSLFD